jgi:diaminopimelate epimerase
MRLENLDFEKHHGLGNDYIIINNLKWKIPDGEKKKLALILCKQHFSVGADGLIFACVSDISDIKMRIFNSDGSEAEMCGNGIRCFARYLYENSIIKKTIIRIETLKGMIEAELTIEGAVVKAVKINMGPPILNCDDIPVIPQGFYDECINEQIMAVDKIFEFTAVSMGNPHAIIFTNSIFDDQELNKYGASIESDERFPNKTNVEFIKILSTNEAILRVFERGVGITNSCGTGSCAAVVAGTILGFFKKKESVIIHNDGGDLEIMYDGKNVFMKGSTVKVFSGIIDEIEI